MRLRTSISPASASRPEGDRDRLAHGADHVRQLLVGQAQVEPDAVRRHAAPPLGELAQLQQQTPLDAGLQGDGHGQLPVGDLSAQHAHEVGGERRVPHPGLHAAPVNQVHERVLDREAAHLGPGRRPRGRAAAPAGRPARASRSCARAPRGASTARARRPPPTTQQSAPLSPRRTPRRPGSRRTAASPSTAAAQRVVAEVGEQVDRAEAGGVGHVVEVITRAMEATVLTVAWAATDAQYPRRR